MGQRALFIGGVAVECYAPYRRTHDIDLVVRERDLHDLRACLEGMGFAHHRPPHLVKHSFKGREAGEVDVYTESVGRISVDEDLFRRGRELRYAGTPVFVVSLEDLLRLKLVAGREIDLTDVAVLLHERGGDVAMGRLQSLVGRAILEAAASRIPDLLPQEYGWQARQRLKGWLRANWTTESNSRRRARR